MSNYILTATSPLSGLDETLGGISLLEITGKALVSIAIPLDGKAELEAALKSAWQLDIPAVGQSELTNDNASRLISLQIDQLFLLSDYTGDQAVERASEQLGNTAYYTDQSDNWVMLQVSGDGCRQALERICPIDLHPDVFADGAVARTVMEHMGVVIIRVGEDSFLLLTMRSMASSLLHAVKVSIKNVS